MTEQINLNQLARDVAVEVLGWEYRYHSDPSVQKGKEWHDSKGKFWADGFGIINLVQFDDDLPDQLFSPQGRDLIEEAMREKGYYIECNAFHSTCKEPWEYTFTPQDKTKSWEYGIARHQNKHIACALAALAAIRREKDGD